MLIKAGFSRQLPKNESINKSRLMKGERGIWQRRYWEHLIRDDYENHVNYIHYNSVKHGYVKREIDWSYSTLHDKHLPQSSVSLGQKWEVGWHI